MKKYFTTRTKYDGQIEVLEHFDNEKTIDHSFDIRHSRYGECDGCILCDHDTMHDAHAATIYEAIQYLGVKERIRRFLKDSVACPGIKWTYHPGDKQKYFDEGHISWEIELVPLYVETLEFITKTIGDKISVRRRGEIGDVICGEIDKSFKDRFGNCFWDFEHRDALLVFCTNGSLKERDEVASVIRENGNEYVTFEADEDEMKIVWTVDIPKPFRN